MANPDTEKVYRYLPGQFPVTSDKWMQYMIILYVYDTYEILVDPIKTRSDADMLRTYAVLYDTLEN